MFYFAIFIDRAAVIANTIGTILGGIFLTVLYFIVGERLLRAPRIGGSWILESTTFHTKYNPFRGMTLRYRVLLIQNADTLRGTAEKFYEKSDRVREFVGEKRSSAVIEGAIQKSYWGRSTVVMHVTEKGERRQFSWIAELKCRSFGSRAQLIGYFSSTASDTSGTLTLEKIPPLERISNYKGPSLVWFARAVELLTNWAYRSEWRELRSRIDRAHTAAKKLWRSDRSHVFIAALVLAEDRRFYSHGGCDPIGMARAIIQTVFYRKIQGASTIEQQLVRVLTADFGKSMRRKFKEIVLAVRLQHLLQKDEIAEVYLSVAYFGWHMNGIRQAAQRVGVDLKHPTLRDAAVLVARIRFPEPRFPKPSRQYLLMRREKWIEKELRKRKYL